MENESSKTVTVDIDEAFIVKSDAGDLCRLCANTDNHFIPIFKGDGVEHNMPNKIEKYLPIIKVSELDKLPLQVCYQCASSLITWHNFYEGCCAADKKLREILSIDEKSYQEDETFDNYVNDYRDEYGDQSRIDYETHPLNPTASTSNLTQNESLSNKTSEITQLEETKTLNETDLDSTDERCLRRNRTKIRSEERHANAPGDGNGDVLSTGRRDERDVATLNQVDVCDCVLKVGRCERCAKRDSFKCYFCPMVFVKAIVRNSHVRASHRQQLLERSVAYFNAVGRLDERYEYDTYDVRVPDEMERSGTGDVLKAETSKVRVPSYECEHCAERFGRKGDMRKHLENEHNFYRSTQRDDAKISKDLAEKSFKSVNTDEAGYYICAVCDQIFLKRHSLTRHVKLHSSSRYDCDKCKKTFTSRQVLDNHQKRKHKEIPKNVFFLNGRKYLKCEQCPFTCRNERNKLEEHMRVHTGEKPFTCELCGKQFRTRSLLRVHRRFVHEGVKEHACDFCGRCFSNKRYMEEHRRIHTGEKPLICDLCGKTFRQNSSLSKHVENHLGIKRHGCHLCGKRFSNSHHLSIHIKRHMGEASFVCNQCGKGFVDQYQLKNHQVVHSEERPFLCLLCGTGFKLLKHLKQHGKTHRS